MESYGNGLFLLSVTNPLNFLLSLSIKYLYFISVHNAINPPLLNPPPFDFVDLKIWIGQLSKTVDMAMCLSSLSVKNLKILFFFSKFSLVILVYMLFFRSFFHSPPQAPIFGSILVSRKNPLNPPPFQTQKMCRRGGD